MAINLQKLLLQAQGKVGKALSTVGTALRAPQLAPGGLGAQLQSGAGYALSQLVPQAKAQTPPPRETIFRTAQEEERLRAWDAAQRVGTNTGGGNIPSIATPPGQAATTGQTPQGIIQSNQGIGNQQIDDDYNQAMAMYDQKQGEFQGAASAASGQIDTGATAARGQIANTQALATQGAETSLQTAERQGVSAMQQARDVFRQTQQQNTAQLSALGISSSSVSEALAERLGVDVARRIAGITGSIQEVRQNTVNELGRIKTYYSGKITDVTNWVNDQKATIQNSLIQGLNQINQARGRAATDKSSSRANLLQQVQTQLGGLAQQQQQFEQSLKLWAEQKSAALTPIMQDPNYINNLIATSQRLQQQFSSTGLQFTPNINVNPQGIMSGQIRSSKQEDEFTNPFQPPKQQPDYNKYPNDGFTY